MRIRYYRRVPIPRTARRIHANISRSGVSASVRGGPVTVNTRRGTSLSVSRLFGGRKTLLGRLTRGLSVRSR